MGRATGVRGSTLAIGIVIFASASARANPAEPDRFRRAQDGGFHGFDRVREGQWSGPFFFVQLTDTQFGFWNDDRSWWREARNVRRAIELINSWRPRFVVVTGDLVNAPPGSRAHEPQVQTYKQLFAALDPQVPLVSVAGNHDVGNEPTPASLACHQEHFGDDYFAFWVGGVRFLALNSTLLQRPARAPEAYAEHRRWLSRELERRVPEARYTIAFQHHPWFLYRADEPFDGYFNMPEPQRAEILASMNRAGVKKVFAGHYHHAAGGRYRGVEVATSGPLSRPLKLPDAHGEKTRDPVGLRVVEIYADRIEHTYYALDRAPKRIELQSEPQIAGVGPERRDSLTASRDPLDRR